VSAKPADIFGDPLPPGAVARLGTRRFCGVWDPDGAVLSPDGTKVATWSYWGLTAWDAVTGRQQVERQAYYAVVADAAGWRADGVGVAIIKLPDRSYFVSAFTDSEEVRPSPPPVRGGATPQPDMDYLALAPDATRLAVVVSVSHDHTGLVWDVTVSALAVGKPAGTGLANAWERLSAADPGMAYAGIAAMAATPAEAVALLREKLRPAPVPTDADLDRVVEHLDAAAFADREKAAAELDRYGPNAVAGAKARLANAESAEVRVRLTRFLDVHDSPNPSPYRLRCARGVAALEAIGTAGARAVLAGLAGGPVDDPLTREALAAVGRGGAAVTALS
jgi:hypothetical protein